METPETIKEKIDKMIELRKEDATTNKEVAKQLGWAEGRIAEIYSILMKKGIVTRRQKNSERRNILDYTNNLSAEAPVAEQV